ncbi:hypothetical protein [Pseudocitrobacter cyperus]|uniref:Uncharacterized protein n=1 Tax=Pseudocitrobacter cyperus TaxID=3112843 RepID=A0ABV0HHV0_9ENTR
MIPTRFISLRGLFSVEDNIFKFRRDINIHYRISQPKYDCQHLLIVMSGFNIPDPTIYDFDMLAHCRSTILWIKDDFNGLPAYYLCHQMKFDIENGVSTLINAVIEYVKPKNISILGASKGGSAALYYGIKHKIKNIITCVPQFNIGSYVASGYWEAVGRSMMGEVSAEKIVILDRYLSGIIKYDKLLQRNIYLFTSRQDKQYQTEIAPHLSLFDKYTSFNLIETASSLVTEHTAVTPYNLNLILALIYQFESGVSPAWGHIRNGDQSHFIHKE